MNNENGCAADQPLTAAQELINRLDSMCGHARAISEQIESSVDSLGGSEPKPEAPCEVNKTGNSLFTSIHALLDNLGGSMSSMDDSAARLSRLV